MSESTAVDDIRSNAALVRSVARDQLGQDFAFDEQAVRWLDGYIQRQHQSGDRAIRDGLVNVLGSFLGECMFNVSAATGR